jgi:hypothetical protein
VLRTQLKNNRLYFGDYFSVSLQRTLRIPDDGRLYPLPPGLGMFPILEVAALSGRRPDAWQPDDFIVPIYQREALWIGFDAPDWRPNAVKIGAGKINAVSGHNWDAELHNDPQDYVVCPPQPWLDGINAGENLIRQFVAMPLGHGFTVEAQITGAEEHGGIQLIIYEPKPGRFPDKPPPASTSRSSAVFSLAAQPAMEMGLGAGGRMKQKIYPDPYGVATWDGNNQASAFVHLVNSDQYRELTGREPPPTPVSAQTYSEHGLPWFELYDEVLGDVTAPESLTGIKSVSEIEREKDVLGHDDRSIDLDEKQIKKI